MNCRTAQRLCLEYEGQPLPAAVAGHLAQCAACRAAQARTQRLMGLLHLKQYEQPPADFAGQCVATVHRRIREQAAETAAKPGWAGWIFRAPQPVFRYALAGACLLLLAFNLLLNPSLPSLDPMLNPAASTDAAASRPVQYATNQLADQNLQPGMGTWSRATNFSPPEIRYHGPPVIPVNLNY